jgi:hypothetical protein
MERHVVRAHRSFVTTGTLGDTSELLVGACPQQLERGAQVALAARQVGVEQARIVQDVQEMKVRLERGCQLDGVGQRGLTTLGEVEREEDATDRLPAPILVGVLTLAW